MWNIKHNDTNTLIGSFKSKHEAKEELDNRNNLCYILKTNINKTYCIERGTNHADKRMGKKRAMS
jgi:hypothetical protein